MKRFIITTALAVFLGLGTSSRAHAQLNYGYTLPAYGGIESAGTTFTSSGPQSYKNFYSPATGYMSETSGTSNTLFGRGNYLTISSPFTGTMTESRGSMMTPFGMASYLNYYSPYTGPVSETHLANSSSANSNNGLVNFNNTVPFGFNHNWNNNGNSNSNNNGNSHWHHR